MSWRGNLIEIADIDMHNLAHVTADAAARDLSLIADKLRNRLAELNVSYNTAIAVRARDTAAANCVAL
jgi:hypothetical protein